ncbi:PKD domain-containing protein [Pedobacter frigoris]|uniref:PKD domain-containing protein n=1 Tax=Pedobacter frigoris TaxID=2571272 RepID=UPI00292EC1BB|nr:PKD domain-containing protein [Pedobacter frigoris]
MKIQIKLTALVLMMIMGFVSCKKQAAGIIDCLGESILTSFSHTTDANNPKKVNFVVKYSGSHTLSSVKFEFGDGQTETVAGTTASHTYAGAGTYSVKARVTLKNNKATCEVDPVKQVVVN